MNQSTAGAGAPFRMNDAFRDLPYQATRFADVLVFAQNAYSERFAGQRWFEEDWLRCFHRSRVGSLFASFAERLLTQRASTTYRLACCTPTVAATRAEALSPQLPHMLAMVRATEPSVVLTLGLAALRAYLQLPGVAQQKAGTLTMGWGAAVVALPHPEWPMTKRIFWERAGDRVAHLLNDAHAPQSSRHVHQYQAAKGGSYDWLVSSFPQAAQRLRGVSDVDSNT